MTLSSIRHCRRHQTPNLMIWKKNIYLRKIVSLTSKLALVCRVQISGVWQALHCMPLQKWNEGTVRLPQQLGPSNLYQTFPSYAVTRPSKYNSFSCYGNKVVMSFRFCNGMQCMPCYWDSIIHDRCQFYKSSLLSYSLFGSIFISITIVPFATIFEAILRMLIITSVNVRKLKFIYLVFTFI